MGDESSTVTVETETDSGSDAPDVVVVDTGGSDGASEVDVDQAQMLGDHGARIAYLEERVTYLDGMVELAVDQAERAADIAVDAEVTAINASIDASEASAASEEAAGDAEEAAEDAEQASDEITPSGRDHWFYRPIGSHA